MKLNVEKSKTFSDRTGSLTPFYKKSTLRNSKTKRYEKIENSHLFKLMRLISLVGGKW